MIDNIMSFYLKDSDTNELVCFHDECYGTYTSISDAYGIEVPFNPIHQFDYYNQRLDILKDHIKPINTKIVYQRLCSNRLCPQTDQALDEIFGKIGAERVPRQYERKNALCCGGGGNFFTDILSGGDDSSARVRIREAVDAGAQILAAACPMCAVMLEDAVKAENLDGRIQVVEVSEIVNKRL